MYKLLLHLCAAGLAAAPLPIDPSGWRPWAARPEIAPRTFVDTVHARRPAGSLAISGNGNAAGYGGWEYPLSGIQPGQWYRFTAFYRAAGPISEAEQVIARLDWRAPNGKRAGQPDYAWTVKSEGEWKRLTLDAPAPEKASAVTLQLYLANAPQATLWWDEVSLEPVDAPARRPVTVAAINFRPSRGISPAENVRRFAETVEQTVTGKADIILLPEGITVVGTGKKYAEVAETVPGPTTEQLGELARRKRAWIVAGIYEREGAAIYNTAVLIDRAGKVTGKYRKVYLPREEVEAGLTPGNDYPVFETDFGKVGVMICWDLQYADPARALAVRGAELILLPIWGGNEALGKARAIENQVFLASSGYNYPTYVMDPNGEILSLARESGSAATATIDLNRRYADPWLGYMRARFMKELRRDLR